jgi:hypothetical protein
VNELSISVTKYLRGINLQEKRFILAHGFRDFSSWVVGSIVSGPGVRQSIVMEGCRKVWQGKLAS